MKTNLPVRISLPDYHDFDDARDLLRQIIPSIKVKEIGFYEGDYQGIAYVGKLTDKKVQAIIDKIKEKEREENDFEN